MLNWFLKAAMNEESMGFKPKGFPDYMALSTIQTSAAEKIALKNREKSEIKL